MATEQEKFEADYLAAFPSTQQARLSIYEPSGLYNDRGVKDCHSVWQQQAARQTQEVESLKATHAAEVAELVAALKSVQRELGYDWLRDEFAKAQDAVTKYDVKKS